MRGLTIRPANFVRVLLLSIVLGGATSADADTLVLQDGTSKIGTIIEDTPEFVRFLDPQLGEIKFPRNQVSNVSKDNSPGTDASGQVDLVSADAEKARGRHAEALQHYVKALAGSTDKAAITKFHAYFKQVYQDGVAKVNTMPDQARELLRGAYMALTLPQAQALFTPESFGASYQQVGTEVSSQLAAANYQLARRMGNNISLRNQVQELLKESVTLTQNKNPAYLLAYGESARNNGDMDAAFGALQTLVKTPGATQEQLNAAYDRLNRIAVATDQRLKVAFTPAAQLTPAVPVVAVAPMATSQTMISNVPVAPIAAPAPDLPVWKRLLESVKSGSIFNELSSLSSGLISTDNLILIAIVLAAFILLWVIPFQILKFLAKRGDTMAAERLFNARKLGPVALIMYLFKRLKEKSVSKHRCPFCNRGIDNMEDYKDLNFVVCPHCREPITPIYEMKDYVDHLIQQLKISQKANAKGHKGDILIEKDAMLKLVRGVLSLAIRRRASDFHMETLNDGGKIRARIDGIMYDLLTLPREISPAFISAIKVMAQLDITERRVPQDGKISLWLDQKDFDLRVNTSPASLGEKVVIRILRQDSINIAPDRLGLEGENLTIFERNINKPHGVIIVTGPSGSGKSTSLYVALNQLNNGDKNIVTIEDPIEYQLQGLSQMQVNPGANFTFANGLRSILRQDPDVIMVGEIRDKETAEAALDAAMTGHLVLTTLHTIDAPSAFSRMHDLGIEQVRVANAVNLVMAQRLVRTICPDCRKTYKPKPTDLEKLNITESDEITYVHGTGCETCMNTGYHGRLAIFEMLELNDNLRSLLETNVPTTALREAARKHGLHTLREEGLRMVREGVTTIEEVIRVTT